MELPSVAIHRSADCGQDCPAAPESSTQLQQHRYQQTATITLWQYSITSC